MAVNAKGKVLALKREKAQMITRYVAMQDKADAMNTEIYELCCGIEALNIQLEVAQDKLRRAGKQKAPVNGRRKSSKKG